MTNETAPDLPKVSTHVVPFDTGQAYGMISYLRQRVELSFPPRSEEEQLAYMVVHTLIREIHKASPNDIGLLHKIMQFQITLDGNVERYLFTKIDGDLGLGKFLDGQSLSTLGEKPFFQIAYSKQGTFIDKISLNVVKQEEGEEHVRCTSLLHGFSSNGRQYEVHVLRDNQVYAVVPIGDELAKTHNELKNDPRPDRASPINREKPEPFNHS